MVQPQLTNAKAAVSAPTTYSYSSAWKLNIQGLSEQDAAKLQEALSWKKLSNGLMEQILKQGEERVKELFEKNKEASTRQF